MQIYMYRSTTTATIETVRQSSVSYHRYITLPIFCTVISQESAMYDDHTRILRLQCRML